MDVTATLTRVARIVVGDHADEAVLARALRERLHTAPAHIARNLSLAVGLLDHPLANLVVAGRFARMSQVSPPDGRTMYKRWLVSRLGVARSIGHGIRRFIVSTYYAQPEPQAALGVPPPLHTRQPVYDWEGSVPGRQREDEPVARASTRSLPDEMRQPARRDRSERVHSAAAWSGTHYFRADVVVVGSGAGGAVAAARLAEAGRDVILVERGRWVESVDFSEREHEIGADLFADRGLRTTDDQAITLLQGGALGGGTTVNWMLMLRTPDHVLDEWQRMYGTEGMAPSDMRTVFDRIEHETHATVVPDDAHNPPNRMLIDGARALGWHVEAARINARGCVRAGTCSLGCRYGAKQSALQVYLPRALAAGARVITDAAVQRVVVTARDTGAGKPPQKRVYVTLRGPDGSMKGEVLIDAPVVVLAAGAVETPLILQRSGLGGGAVGRFLRLHPTTALLARMPNVSYPLAGVPQTSLCAEFARKNDDYGYWIECPALTPGLAAAAASGIGAAHHGLLAQLAYLAPLIVLVRDGVERDRSNGSVTMGRGGAPRIRYRLGARDEQLLREGVASAARLALAGGARAVATLHARPIVAQNEGDLAAILSASVAPNDMSLFSAHVNGTCRIGRWAADAGVKPNGERFGVRGLYVVDGSILPTAPGVNPQETIYALATVLTERMILENKV
ncbi:MAG: GMC family oxidoreductase N-terminal domain-containing protein [Gemmatimonadaceae bacterium]